MNVYDFDGTIYNGETSRDFFFFCLKRYPKVKRYIPKILFYGLGYVLRIVDKTKFKNKFYTFLHAVRNVDYAVERFWKRQEVKIHKWYLEKKQPTDVIISASPEFMLRPIAKKLGVERLMGTKVDKETGYLYSTNCHGEEKVRRFREMYPDASIEEFYSDMYSDTPLAKIADQAFLVKGEKLKPWSEKKLMEE